MNKLLKNIKKAKFGLSFLIIGLIFTILFVCLLMINHLNIIKINDAYKTFDKYCNYEIVLNESKKSKKMELFQYGEYHFYGYGINKVNISYKNVIMNLKKAFEKEYLSIKEFLENLDLIYQSSDNTITKYQYGNYIITIENLFNEYKEVIISKLN